MARRNSPPTQDIPNLIGSDEKKTTENILEYWEKPIVPWNYSHVNKKTPFIINHSRNREEAASIFTRIRHKVCRSNNMSVGAHIFDKYHDTGNQAYELLMKRLILRDKPLVETIVRPSALVVRNGNLKILINQPRQNFQLSPEDWAFYAWLIQRAYSTSDEAGTEIEFFDTSVGGNGERNPRSFSALDLPSIDPREALEKVSMFVRSFDRALALAPPLTKQRRSSRGGDVLPLFPEL
jgi:hypothetical protein